MRYREYEFRQIEEGKWEIVKWYQKEVPVCVTVMIMKWNKKARDIDVEPIMDRVLETYDVARFDKWLDICLRYISLIIGEDE